MKWLNRTSSVVRKRAPCLYGILKRYAYCLASLLFRRRISKALQCARIEGIVDGKEAVKRPIGVADCDQLVSLLASMSPEHLRWFHPHAFDAKSVRDILGNRLVMTYGLFVDGILCAYALLQLSLAKKAYMGLLVAPSLTGLGIGKFLARYLYWQANVLGFKPYTMICKDNIASMKAHASAGALRIVAQLPNNFQRICFDISPKDNDPPKLSIKRRMPCSP